MSTFCLDSERYALDSVYLREIVLLKELTPLPTVPPYVAGIFNLRGQIVTALDLRVLLGMPPKPWPLPVPALVLGTTASQFALLADSILGTERFPPQQLQKTLVGLSEIREKYWKGVLPGRLALLDGAKLLGDETLLVKEEVI